MEHSLKIDQNEIYNEVKITNSSARFLKSYASFIPCDHEFIG